MSNVTKVILVVALIAFVVGGVVTYLWCNKHPKVITQIETQVIHDTIKITDTKYKVITTKGKIVYQDKVITWEDTSKIASLETLLAEISGQTHTEIQYVDRVKEVAGKTKTFGIGLLAGGINTKPITYLGAIPIRYHRLLVAPTVRFDPKGSVRWTPGMQAGIMF